MEGPQLTALSPSHGVPELQPVSWIVALGLLFSLSLGMAMGSNDVANAFGTSVGAEVLSMQQAIIVAIVCTFSGAVTLGPGVTQTVAGKIVNIEVYADKPEQYMLGMFCALVAAACCVGLATRFGLPVSTTHAIIGAIAGFSLVEASNGVLWWPNMGLVVLSWVVSPLLAGGLSFLLFVATKRLVLRADRDLQLPRQRLLVSLIVGAIVFLAVVFIGAKTAEGALLHLVPLFALVGLGLAATTAYFLVLPRLLAGVRTEERPLFTYTNGRSGRSGKALFEGLDGSDGDGDETPEGAGWSEDDDTADLNEGSLSVRVGPGHGQSGGTAAADSGVEAIHGAAEVFDETLEHNFKLVQVMSASLVAFSQGANDISNSAGPLLSIWDTYGAGRAREDLELQYWVVLLSGVGVIAGLALFGQHVIRTVGTKITRITASRGYCVELATASSVLGASFVGLPVSTTHCAIGAIVAVGLVNDTGKTAVQWPLIGKVVLSWVLTLPLAAIVAIVLYEGLKPTLDGIAGPPNATLVFCTGNCTAP